MQLVPISQEKGGGDVAAAFAVGAFTGFFTGGLSGAAGSVGRWAALGAASGAATGAGTAYATGGGFDEVVVAAILGASAGTISGVAGNNVAFNNAMALLRKQIANAGWNRSDLAGDLAAAIAALGITVGADQLDKLLNEIIEKTGC